MNIPNPRPVVAIACLLLLAAGTLPLSAAGATQQCSTIDGPTTITDPGCYELTSDVTNADGTTYVTIAADDVVLDGNGHTIDGTSAAESSAVVVDGSEQRRSNVTIRDLVTAEWERGIVLRHTDDVRIERVTVRESTDAGIVVEQSTGAVVRDSRAWGINGPGVRLTEVSGSTIADTSLEIVGSGIESSRSGTNTLRNVTVTSADGAGFVATDSTAETTASGVEIAGVESLAFAALDVRLSGVDDDPPERSGYRQIGRLIEVSKTSANGFLAVTRTYGDTDAADVPPSDVSLWQYSRTTGEWRQRATGTGDDPVVTATVIESGPIGLFTEAAATRVSIASVDEQVTAGDAVTVDAEVTNTGSEERSRTVSLSVDGRERNATTVTLPPGETVPVTLGWQTDANDSGEYTATVTSGDASAETAVTVGERTSMESILTVSPVAPSFGETRVGTSTTRTITVENTGNETVAVTDLGLDGAVEQFRVTGGSLALGVAPGETRSVTIAFEPTRGGPASATARIQTSAQGTVEIPLTGTGIAEIADLDTGSDALRFGNRTVDETVTRSVTVRNAGEAELTVSDVLVVGRDRSAFTPGTDGFTLAPGTERTVAVTFTPTSTGSKHATLRLLSNDPDEPQTDIWLANSDTVVRTEVSSTDTETRVNATFSNVSADEMVEVNVSQSSDAEKNFSLASVGITVDESTNFTANLTSSGETLSSTPEKELPNATEGVGYLSINTTADDDSITQANVSFRLSRSALDGTDPGDVSLYRYHDGEWQELPTRVRSVGQRYASFVATTTGFSEFSAGAKQPSFEFARGNVSLSTVTEGESVDIEVLITNEGGADGTFVADLLLNGEVVETRQVTIAAGGSRLLVFERTFDQNGTYEVRVNDQQIGEIRVTEEGVTSPVDTTTTISATGGGTDLVSIGLLPLVGGVILFVAFALLGGGLLLRRGGDSDDEPSENGDEAPTAAGSAATENGDDADSGDEGEDADDNESEDSDPADESEDDHPSEDETDG